MPPLIGLVIYPILAKQSLEYSWAIEEIEWAYEYSEGSKEELHEAAG